MIAISFLGLGKYDKESNKCFYEKAKYRYLNKTIETSYFAFAVNQFISPDKLFIVSTMEGFANHEFELNKLLSFEKIIIPFGKTEDELWQMFEQISIHIPQNESLTLDITHGFRSQPIIALAIAAFLRITKNVTIEKILYGAFEAKDSDGVTPVFDLTNFFNIIDWAYCIQHFTAHGDSKPLKKLLDTLHKKIYLERKQPITIKNFGNLLNNITQSLTFIRPEEVSSLSKELPEKINAVKNDINSYQELNPLKYLLDSIPKSFSSLVNEDKNIFSPSGFKMQSEMIKYYFETEQFVQAVTLSREVFISLVCMRENYKPLKKDERIKAEALLYEWNTFHNKGFKLEEFPSNCSALWGKITNARNDIDHAGMRENPCPAKSLNDQVKHICHKTVELIYASQPI